MPAAALPVNARALELSRRLEIPVLVAALLVVPVMLIEQSAHGASWSTAVVVANAVIWAVFAAELAALLVVADDRKRLLLDRPLDVAIVVLTPPFLPAGLQAARAFRLLRVLRLARVAVSVRTLFSVNGLRWAGLLAGFIALGGGTAFAAVEKHQHLSEWDGIYWAITTMSTVGYGDVGPQTDLGRLIAMVVMLTGIGLLGMLAGALANAFVSNSAEAPASKTTDDAVLARLDEISARLARLEHTRSA